MRYLLRSPPKAQYYTADGQTLARQMFGNHARKEDGYQGNIRTRGGLMYYQYDGLGNVMDITDRLGSQVMGYRYDAFGNLFTQMAAPYNAVGYTGKTYDAKAGLMDYSARWYSPNVGRFSTPDTYEGTLTNPLSLNRYIYVADNPVNLIDPTGHTAGSVNYSGMPQISSGSTGSAVVTLQTDLNKIDFAGLTVDGDFGPLTDQAVRNFQDRSKIQVDGIVGQQTWKALQDAINTYNQTGGESGNGNTGTGSDGSNGSSTGDNGNSNPPPPSKSDQFNEQAGTTPPLQQYGSQGAYVTLLQEYLNEDGAHLTVDGVYGAGTQKAVKQFQSSIGINNDGIVGVQTWVDLELVGSVIDAKTFTPTPTSNYELAVNLANKYGGAVTPTKGDGWKVTIGKNSKIVIRVMNEGGTNQNTGQPNENYWRMSVSGIGAIDGNGKGSNDRGVTHQSINKQTFDQLSSSVDQYLPKQQGGSAGAQTSGSPGVSEDGIGQGSTDTQIPEDPTLPESPGMIDIPDFP